MIKRFLSYACLASSLFGPAGCRQAYDPPAASADYKYLVVDGFANSGQDSTIIHLSRTRKLVDTVQFVPELNASVSILQDGGGAYFLAGRGNGEYASGPLPLQADGRYRLRITTADGRQYVSDFVPVTNTPPIDSVTWYRDKGIFIQVHTHDPLNNTHYYRWDYSETWEYHSFYESGLVYKNGQVYLGDSSEIYTICWSSDQSDRIILGTSEKLGEDVIANQPITSLPEGSAKLSYKYSILVRQYGLSRDAFTYWQELEKTSQQSGTLFDSQPTQLIGNMHCESNPAEPVIGFFSVSAIREMRLFIKRSEVTSWPDPDYSVTCTPVIFPLDSASYYLQDTSYLPAYFITGGGLAIAKRICVDCRLRGGTSVRPPFWQ